MIVGTVTDNGLPTTLLSVAGQTWQATIDTAFNGDLELPEALRSAVNARHQRFRALAGSRWENP